MIKVVMANNVRVENPPSEIAHKLIDKYTVSNPDYYKLERLGKWTGNTPEKLAMWERDGKTLVLPYGAIVDVMSALTDAGYGCCMEHNVSYGDRKYDYKSSINLYEYQQKAVQAAMGALKGVLVAPCGSGKTQMGLAIAAKLGLKTLWLTHTHDLLNQSMSRAKQVFDLKASDYGTIAAGKVEIGGVITFATVQTMAKLDLTAYRDTWGCIIVDEAHHVAGTPTKLMQFSKVIGSLNAAYKFGLTATPKRADGLIACMYAYLGPKFWEVSREEVGDKTCPVEYMRIQTGFDCDYEEFANPDGTLNYVELINVVCQDADRNQQIARVIDDILQIDGARVLVLSERVSHLEKLVTELIGMGANGSPCSVISGKTKKSWRDNAIMELKSGQSRLMFATYQLAKEGLDIPELTHLILASPNKTETVITQAVGRVARACDGKKRGIVIDFVDGIFPLSSWASKRERIYKKLGYKPR